MKDTIFLCVTNIPSSYRVHAFNCFQNAMRNKGINFQVIFMAKTEPGRYWSFEKEHHKFRSTIASGIHITIKNLTLHFNPFIIFDIIKIKPKWILLGGGWNLPTVILLTMLIKMLLPHITLLFWLEATTTYTHFSKTGILKRFKRFILSLFNGYVVPGVASVIYLHELALDHKPIIHLSNFVDEEIYYSGLINEPEVKNKVRASYNLNESDIVFLLPARLVPEKGILEFLDLSHDSILDFKILIAGDGPLKLDIETKLSEYKLKNVILLGHQNTENLIKLYSISDLLLLPSLKEPYGFVCVEGLWASLPMLLSKHVGAIFEVVNNNGWVFDFEKNDIAGKLEEIKQAGREGLKDMGKYSLKIARRNFNSLDVVENFIEEILINFP